MNHWVVCKVVPYNKLNWFANRSKRKLIFIFCFCYFPKNVPMIYNITVHWSSEWAKVWNSDKLDNLKMLTQMWTFLIKTTDHGCRQINPLHNEESKWILAYFAFTVINNFRENVDILKSSNICCLNSWSFIISVAVHFCIKALNFQIIGSTFRL